MLLGIGPLNRGLLPGVTTATRRTRTPARRWGTFPTTADIGIWATGPTADALFEALGLGLSSIITDLRRVRPTDERAVSASAEDATELVVAFLNELILLQSADGFLVRQLTVHALGSPPTSLVAAARGETFAPDRHAIRTEVKAATFHELVFDLAAHRARVIVDI
jgi:SHS2 domain-containing protein